MKQKINKQFAPAFFFLLALFCFSCTYDKVEPVIICNLPATVSFKNDLIPVFESKCSTAGCHSVAAAAGNLVLDSANAYSQLMNPGPGYVDTVHPKSSIVYSRLYSASNPMPPNKNMDECQKRLILKWIEQKAKNN